MKKLRRVCLFLLFVIFFAGSTFEVSAVERYASHPLYWQHYSGNSLYIAWFDYNVSNWLVSSNLSGGHDYWANNSSDVSIICEEQSSSYGNPRIAHATPTSEWWESNVSPFLDVYAACEKYDSNGTVITDSNYSGCTNYIRSANIYYTPDESLMSQLNVRNIKCMIAHEIGHALGYGEYNMGDSIMNQGVKTFSGLQQYDLNELERNY